MKHFIVILGALGTSLSPVFRRFSTAPTMVLVFYRVGFAALLMTPYVLLRQREALLRLKRREFLLCVCSGIFLGLHFLSYFEALRYTSIVVAEVLVNTEVLFVTLGSIAFLKKHLSGKGWLAVFIAFAGSVVVSMADLAGGGALKGNLLAVLGAVLGAAYTLVGTVCRRGGISTTLYTYILYLSAAITALLLTLASGIPPVGYEPLNLWTTLGMAVCCTLLGHSLYSWGLKFLPASFVAMSKLMEPVFAAVWGLIIFSERPGLPVICGGIVVILGIALFSRVEKEA